MSLDDGIDLLFSLVRTTFTLSLIVTSLVSFFVFLFSVPTGNAVGIALTVFITLLPILFIVLTAIFLLFLVVLLLVGGVVFVMARPSKGLNTPVANRMLGLVT